MTTNQDTSTKPTINERVGYFDCLMRASNGSAGNALRWSEQLPWEERKACIDYLQHVRNGGQRIVSDEQWERLMSDPSFRSRMRSGQSAYEAQLSANAFWIFLVAGLLGFLLHPIVGWVLIGIGVLCILSSFAATSRQMDAQRFNNY